ncbi:hypothetical protein SRHO_G00342880 [Serrasalmus rhombeus]
MLSKWNSSPDLTHLVGTGPHCCPRDPNPEEADDDGWMDGWMLKLCSEVEFFRSTLNGATPGTRSLRPGEPGKLRKMCPERDASALSGFIPPWERQRFNTHSFRQQNSELCAGAALRGTTRTAGTCLRLLSNGGGGGAHCDRSCGNGISLKHKTWSLSPSVQSVSVMKATLLVLLLSAVAVMLSCDHQHSEREAGPGCPLGKRLAFDVNTTIEESKRLNNEYFDCPNPEPGAPCFYYSHVFYPFFVIEDTVVGESDRFHDSYTFKVVGGGRTRESVRNYSQEEILKFNSLRDSESYQQTLVWTFDDVPDSFPLTKEGFIVMRGASNRVRWLCQRNSPCGDLTPVNHLDPDFYFVVEVSNMETAGSPFCEYTVRFELHVHGFPLDPVRALFFHQMTMTVVQTILICYIGHTCWRLKRKTVYTKTRDGLDEQEGHEQFNAGDVGVNVGCTLRSCCLHLYHIIFGIVQNPVLDHVILLVVLLDTSTLMAHTFQSVTVTTSWCLSASPDVKEGEAQSTKKAGEDLDVSLAEIEEEFYKEALRHASSDGKHSKRKIELTKRYLQLLAAMDQHAQKYRSQACLLDKLVETFFMDQDEETRSDAVE